jgi:hypothetical protein
MAWTPKLGWIPPEDRTKAQEKAHDEALARMPNFSMPDFKEPTGPVKVVLTDLWEKAEIVKELGTTFTGFHQLTGSCVGASEGNAVATLSFVQALLTDGATRPFIPWWPFPYGRTRYHEGDRGQGEGAVDSVMGDTLGKEGVFAITEAGLPQFDTSDGFALTEKIEMAWSDGASALVTKWLNTASPNPLGTHAPVYDVAGIRQAVINGYPILDGCNNYVGRASIQGSGANAVAIGSYTDRGGHSTCILGYWDHPDFGPLYLYSNQWPSSVYPKDPGGGGRCCCWLKEGEMAKLFKTGGGNGETMALSHLKYFPAQPKVLDNWMAL